MSLALLTCLYAVAFGTSAGRRADALSARDLDATLDGDPSAWRWLDIPTDLAWPRVESPAVLGLLAAAVVGYGLVRRRYARAVAAGLLMPATVASAELLKLALGGLDPLGGEAARILAEDSFPSGHSAFFMSLAFALLVVVPRRLLGVAAIAGGLLAGVVGVVAVVDLRHYPSDVAGGYLLALVWAAIVAEILTRAAGEERHGWPAVGSRGAAVLLALLAAGATYTVVVGVAQPDGLSYQGAGSWTLAVGPGLMTLALLAAAGLSFLIGTRGWICPASSQVQGKRVDEEGESERDSDGSRTSGGQQWP